MSKLQAQVRQASLLSFSQHPAHILPETAPALPVSSEVSQSRLPLCPSELAQQVPLLCATRTAGAPTLTPLAPTTPSESSSCLLCLSVSCLQIRPHRPCTRTRSHSQFSLPRRSLHISPPAYLFPSCSRYCQHHDCKEGTLGSRLKILTPNRHWHPDRRRLLRGAHQCCYPHRDGLFCLSMVSPSSLDFLQRIMMILTTGNPAMRSRNSSLQSTTVISSPCSLA